MAEPTPTARGLVARVWNAFDGLAADTLWSGAHDLAQLVTALVSFLLLQQSLELEQYGAYVGFYGLVGVFGSMSYAGLGLALLQRLLGEGDDPDGALRSFLSLALMIGLGAIVVGGLMASAWIELSTAEILFILVAELLGVAVVFLSAILVQARAGFAAATRVKLVVIVLRLIVVVSLFVTDQLTIRNLAAGFLVSFLAYGVYLLIVHLPRHGYRVRLGAPTGTAMRASTMFAIPMGASKLQTDGDKFLLNVFAYRADAGLYGAAYRIVQLGTLPLLALDAAAFQRFLPRGEGERGLHWRRATRMGALMVGASAFVGLAMYLVLPVLAAILIQEEEYREAVDIVPWLLFLVPLIATSNSPMNGLLGLGRVDKRMLVYLSAALVSLAGYLILIPPFSWRGAVAATFIGEVYLSVVAWSSLWYYQRRADAELDRQATVGA